MKTHQDKKGHLQHNKQKKFNGVAGILLLLISVTLITTFSAFSPTSSDLPLDYQNIDISSSGLPFGVEEPLNINGTIQQSDQQKSLNISVPDSTKKSNQELDKDVDTDIDTDVDTKIDMDIESDIDKAQDINEDKELERELEKAEKELEKAEIEIDKAMKAYDQAMIEYQKTISKSKNIDNVEAWSIAEKDYAKALALAELQLEQIELAIPAMEELRITEILEDQLEELEILSLDEQIDISHDLIEEAIELHELDTELFSEEMMDQFELIQDQLNLQMEEFEDVLEDQIEELENIRELEFEAQLLETKIKSELIKDKLIENEKDKLSFILSTKKLEVNGQILSKELHKKYLELYEDISDERLEGTTKLIFQD